MFAFVKFIAVGLFTYTWCCNVGHPPVFIRESVIAKAGTDEIQITLNNVNHTGGDDNNENGELHRILQNEKVAFATRYDAVRMYIDSLAKPVGSLGTLEDWAARLAVLQKSMRPSADSVSCLIFAGDHGVAKDRSEGGENCSEYPQAVTFKVLQALDRGFAGASVLAEQNGVRIKTIDVGVVTAIVSGNDDVNWQGHVTSDRFKIAEGTKNFCKASAMSKEEVDNSCYY